MVDIARNASELVRGAGDWILTQVEHMHARAPEWLIDQHELAIAALGELGLGTAGVPSPRQIASSMNDATVTFLEESRTNGEETTLIIAPCIGGSSEIKELVRRFDAGQPDRLRTNGHLPEWIGHSHLTYQPEAHDNGSMEEWQVGFLLNDTTDPLDGGPANEYDQPGLVYPNRLVAEQRALVEAEVKAAGELGVDFSPITLGMYFLANARLRLKGQLMLDQKRPEIHMGTHTRLVHYEDTYYAPAMGRASHIIGVSDEGKTILYRSYTHLAHPDQGVRRMVRVPVSKNL